MDTAKIFQHGGSQAVRLPKEYRFDVTEVSVERRGRSIVLTPLSHRGLVTLADVAADFKRRYKSAERFPDVPRTKDQQARDLEW